MSFLHCNGRFAEELPDIRQRIVALGRNCDQSHWGQMAGAGLPESELGIRYVEYHRMVQGAGLANPKHYDSGSTVTVDIMLTDTEEFDGGQFRTLEADGKFQAYDFEQGDALVFASHKYHCVSALTSGKRSVLVTELWTGGDGE